MGNIAGALESPRFTTLPRPSHSDAIYLPNCSSDAFITLLDLSPYNKIKKKTNQKNKTHTKFLSLLLSPLDRGGGKGVRGECCRNLARGCEPCRSGLCGVGWEAREAASLGSFSWWGLGNEPQLLAGILSLAGGSVVLNST